MRCGTADFDQMPQTQNHWVLRIVPRDLDSRHYMRLMGRGATIQGPSGHNQDLEILSFGAKSTPLTKINYTTPQLSKV